MRLLARLLPICRQIEGNNEFSLEDILMPYNWNTLETALDELAKRNDGCLPLNTSQHLQAASDVLRVNYLVNSRNDPDAKRKAKDLKEESSVIRRKGKAIFTKTWHIANTWRTWVLRLPEEKPTSHDMKLLRDILTNGLMTWAARTLQRECTKNCVDCWWHGGYQSTF